MSKSEKKQSLTASEYLELAIKECDNTGEFQEEIICAVSKMLTGWLGFSAEDRARKSDWMDFLEMMQRENPGF